MRKKVALIAILLFMLLTTVTGASGVPMLQRHIKDDNGIWEYEKSGKRFTGYVPALGREVKDNPWKLYQWQGVFTFADGQKQTIDNYDVFAVKEKPGDPSFSDQNGFGLTYNSKEAVGELFDAIWSGHMIVSQKQQQYFRDKFTVRGTDYDEDHDYYYILQGYYKFLRTSGIVSRMGVQFDRTQKVDGKGYAYFNVTKWPELKVTLGEELMITHSSYGVENGERQVDVYALPKGAFPDMSKRVKITSIMTSSAHHIATVKAAATDLSRVLGKEVDIVLDDGYGRTQIESVTLADNLNMDFVPTKLTLTEGGQLWIKFKYQGEDILTADYTSKRGMPMTAAVKIGGAVTTNFDLSSMFKELPEQLRNDQDISYMLGKIEISDAPGKYYIKADVRINNPDHPDRALESPAEAYYNNDIQGQWTIERKTADTDLIAISITASPSSITKGSSSSITAQVKNLGAEVQNDVLIRFYDNSKQIYEVRKTLPANKTVSVGPFSWQGDQTGIHALSVHVDPDKEKPDKNRTNNIASTGCSVSGGANGGGGECNNTKVDRNWTVTYPLITGYPTKTRTVTWTDSEGKSHSSTESYTDYNDPIWETRNVQYTEQLNIEADVSTKQGIKTDLDHPKETDRHSRGSWEIIPYARDNNKDPDQVTRAGYGFELAVKTKYTNDWEEKVPVGLEGTAKPIGGQYYGPDQVTATIYDTEGRLVKKITLEKTSGDRNNATWEFPEVTSKSESGKTYKDRKFYTAVDAPDGYYTVRIETSAAGMTGVISCITKKVEIWGSMYDDVQNLRASQ